MKLRRSKKSKNQADVSVVKLNLLQVLLQNLLQNEQRYASLRNDMQSLKML